MNVRTEQLKRWLPLLAAAVLALLVWQQFSQQAALVGGAGSPSVEIRFTQVADRLSGTLATIKDETSAAQSLPALRQAAAVLLDLRDMAEKLTPPARKALAQTLGPAVARLQAAAKSTADAPGSGTAVKPVLDQITERLGALTRD